MKLLIIFFFALFSAVGALSAEEIQARFTGGVTSYADEGADNHGTVGGSARFYLTRRWSVEPEYLYQRGNAGHFDQVVWGNIAFDFLGRNRKVVPYWYGAPGVIYSSTRFGSFKFTNTEAAISTGLGARFYVTDRVFLTPQVRFGLADSVFAEVTGSIGFVIRK